MRPAGTVYEVRRNKAGKWFYRVIEAGKILSRSAPYYSKWNAKRAAKVRQNKTPGSIFRVV